MLKKKNCWEIKNCGRHEGGEHAQDLGVCPATTEKRLHGIHEGDNAGRTCWVVVGTLCKGEVQGSFAQKYKNCEKCEFYQGVRKEEGGRFMLSAVLLNKIRG
ncbi:MAG: two-CW domain-containing protein [Nitrospirota bacterium]